MKVIMNKKNVIKGIEKVKLFQMNLELKEKITKTRNKNAILNNNKDKKSC